MLGGFSDGMVGALSHWFLRPRLDGWTPLQRACYDAKGDGSMLAVVVQLFEQGVTVADVNMVVAPSVRGHAPRGWSPLNMLCEQRCTTEFAEKQRPWIVRLLLHARANPMVIRDANFE